jgi:hypothetical protein
MKRTAVRTSIVLGLVLALLAALAEARPPRGMRSERGEHPRIAKAIHSLDDAIDYMQKAPHDFGGHREEAIRASRAAIEQLKLALAYRAGQDNRRH